MADGRTARGPSAPSVVQRRVLQTAGMERLLGPLCAEHPALKVPSCPRQSVNGQCAHRRGDRPSLGRGVHACAKTGRRHPGRAANRTPPGRRWATSWQSRCALGVGATRGHVRPPAGSPCAAGHPTAYRALPRWARRSRACSRASIGRDPIPSAGYDGLANGLGLDGAHGRGRLLLHLRLDVRVVQRAGGRSSSTVGCSRLPADDARVYVRWQPRAWKWPWTCGSFWARG